MKLYDSFILKSLILCLLTGFIHAQFPDFPPDTVSHQMDRDQMIWQLGLSYPSLPPKPNDPNAPQNGFPADSSNPDGNWTDLSGHVITRSGFGLWNNYDDTENGFFPGLDSWRVGDYTPIDLLKMKDGIPIQSAEMWWELRRPELLKDVREQVWGVTPPDRVLPAVTWTVTEVTGGDDTDLYVEKTITGTIDISRYPNVRNGPEISAVLRIPADQKDPCPVMVVIGHPRWTRVDRYYAYGKDHGWGACIFDCNALQPDHGAGLTSYLIGLCNQGHWRKPADWGTLAAWAWGVSKLIDYFETDAKVDASQIGVTGHSRWGKATMVAMAYDSRIAIGYPSCAGSLGTKMNRRHWGQDLENSGWDREYHWMAGNFFKWMGPLHEGQYLPRKIENCPVDAHSLLALCAPRPVFLNAGAQDTWTDPYGIYLTGVAATPVYELLGKEGLIMSDEKPQVDVAYISGHIGFRYHSGGHTDAPDWPAFYAFAEQTLGK
ncbi:alpha/beta hydrolase family protein [bacterium]